MNNVFIQSEFQCNYTPRVAAKDLRDAMDLCASAMNMVTTDGPAHKADFTAQAAPSVRDEPPSILKCVNNSSSIGPTFKRNKYICVNTIGPKHEPLTMLFGSTTTNKEHISDNFRLSGPSDAPVLDRSLVSVDCRVPQLT